MRSGDGGDATNGGGRGRGGIRHDEADRGAVSEEDGDNEESKVDSDSARRGPLSSVSREGIRINASPGLKRHKKRSNPSLQELQIYINESLLCENMKIRENELIRLDWPAFMRNEKMEKWVQHIPGTSTYYSLIEWYFFK